jgi:hypothetical protein
VYLNKELRKILNVVKFNIDSIDLGSLKRNDRNLMLRNTAWGLYCIYNLKAQFKFKIYFAFYKSTAGKPVGYRISHTYYILCPNG